MVQGVVGVSGVSGEKRWFFWHGFSEDILFDL